MFSNEPAAITAAIRNGSLQQVQAEPRQQPTGRALEVGRSQPVGALIRR
ncbi:hypothetical protein [Micropruina sonneratiae]|nr:hypothetical protein [Micropruina sp. KQZ13P-5]MCW3156549.1 hypothetical protein [Micropruina sp. KQZ13P-5]